MADYCTVTDALSLLGNFTVRDAVAYSAGPPVIAAVTATEPTATQAAALLAQTTAEIDMHLRGQGYSVPASDAEAVASLKAICMNGAAARIAKARWPSDSGPGGDRGVAMALREDYRRGLDFIDSGGLASDSSVEDTSGSVNHGMPDVWPPTTEPF